VDVNNIFLAETKCGLYKCLSS